MTLASNTRLGPYEISGLIGRGATGEVYKAVDTRLNRTVAIKMLTGPDKSRLEREARAVAALNHPYICAIYDITDEYLVMEYVDGAPMKGPMPLGEALRSASQLATALEVAHARGIVHRDLKPDNILVTAGGVKVLDFGHAKQLSSSDAKSASGPFLGTPAYMSPEQAHGGTAEVRSDVFSFGLVLYELVAGRRPFSGETMLQLLNSIVNDEPRSLDTLPELQLVVTRCLRKDPAQRYQSMTEVREALARVPRQTREDRPSIAVLPFDNLSGSKDNDYFSEGLTAEIISQLAKIPGLRVTARTSAFAFRKRQKDVRKIAELLDVETILEGTVRESETRLRVTAQLISAADGYHLWSQSYDREKADIFAIQDDISSAIARALKVRLHHQSTVNIPAYESYLKARYHLWRLTPESMALTRESFERAIALDPHFALAHSGLADYFLARSWMGIDPESESMPAARISASKALEIDASISQAHGALATVATLYDFDRREAERRWELALALARDAVPTVVRLRHAYYYLVARGRTDDALTELREALRNDPLNATLHYGMGICLLKGGRDAESREEFHQALELDEHYFLAMTMLAAIHWSHNQKAEAVGWAERACESAPWNGMPAGVFAGMLAWSGDTARAGKIVEKLRDGQAHAASLGLTIFHALSGNIDEATRSFEQVIRRHHVSGAFGLLHSPLGKTLLSAPGFSSLASTLRLHETILPAN